jgi:hypothetical protein
MDLKVAVFESIYYIQLKIPVFWDIISSSPVKVNRYFGKKYRALFQFRRVSEARNQHEGDCKQIQLAQVKE